jgi:hypothetical protein
LKKRIEGKKAFGFPGGRTAILWLALAAALPAAEAITAEDADGKKVRLNAEKRVTVIIGSNENVQQRTRAAGKALDEFQGRPDFRAIVLVDLRDSIGNLVPWIVRGRMRADLDKEALRITPAYRANGNQGDPRADVSAVPDFDGKICRQVEWEKPAKTLRVVVFGKDGAVARRWEDLADYAELQAAVRQALEAGDPRGQAAVSPPAASSL